MKEFAIYTAVVGDYDNIQQPVATDDRFDYYLFSNDIKEGQIGVWQVRSIPYKNPVQTKIARWVKTHPEELLSDYQYSVWIDANIQIRSSQVYERIVQLSSTDTLFASMWHHERNCIYDEAIELLASSMEHESVVYRWIHHIQKEGYPKHNGLFESGVMFRKHSNSRVKQTDELWWACIEDYSKRDQLSFNYALWRNHLSCDYFLPQGENVRNSDCFVYTIHTNSCGDILPNKKDDPFLNYFARENNGYDKDYLARFHSKHLFHAVGFFTLIMIGQYYRIKHHLR